MAASLCAMRWIAYLDPDSVFLALDEEVMVYHTPTGIAQLQFSGEDVLITTYPDAAAFAEAMKGKHAGLVTRVAAMIRLTA
jgi:hypothetical protein